MVSGMRARVSTAKHTACTARHGTAQYGTALYGTAWQGAGPNGTVRCCAAELAQLFAGELS